MPESKPRLVFFLLVDGVTVDVADSAPEGATVVDPAGERPFWLRKLTAAALAAVLALHAEWYPTMWEARPLGVRARLDGASLDGARLDGASLDGASLVRARLDGASLDRAWLAFAGPVGVEQRIVAARRLADGSIQVRAGCREASPEDVIAAIEDRYADGTGRERHRAAYMAAVRCVVTMLDAVYPAKVAAAPDAPEASTAVEG